MAGAIPSLELVCLDSSVDYRYIFTAFSQKSPLFSVLRGEFTGQGRNAVSSLRINISKLSEGDHSYSLSTEPPDIGLDSRFDRNVEVEALVEKANRQIVLRVESRTGGRFMCDRCLDEFRQEVKSEHTIVYVQGGDPPEELQKNQEFQYLPQDVNIVDLGEDVRQYLILSLPLKMLCKEECAGLCPMCGTNRNTSQCSCTVEETDPRWATLKGFQGN